MSRRTLVGAAFAVFCATLAALPVSATVIDDFSGDSLDANWVQSRVLTVGTGSYSFGTTSPVAGALNVTMSDFSGTAVQDLLLRSDYTLGIGDTLWTDVVSPQTISDLSGLTIGVGTGITDRTNMLCFSCMASKVEGVYFDKDGNYTFGGAVTGLSLGSSSRLFIKMTSATTYDVGYDLGTGGGPVTAHTFTVADGSPSLGAAVGYITDLRGNGSVAFDNLQINGIPEPSACTIMVTGVIGLAAYAWRKRR
jgi:hypothetical protein